MLVSKSDFRDFSEGPESPNGKIEYMSMKKAFFLNMHRKAVHIS